MYIVEDFLLFPFFFCVFLFASMFHLITQAFPWDNLQQKQPFVLGPVGYWFSMVFRCFEKQNHLIQHILKLEQSHEVKFVTGYIYICIFILYTPPIPPKKKKK